MSKNKKKDANPKGDVPLDFQVESKNLQYTITLKDMEIDTLKQENLRKKQYILELEKEIQKLKKDYIQAYKLENTIKGNNKKIEKHEREIENLNNQIKDQKNKNEEEKKQIFPLGFRAIPSISIHSSRNNNQKLHYDILSKNHYL